MIKLFKNTNNSTGLNQSNGSLFGELYEWNEEMNSNSMENIKSLRISDDYLFSYDDFFNICEKMDLSQLFLHNLPNLTDIPYNIMKLSNLKVLSIIQCYNITELPLSIRYLFNLETLHVDCNVVELPIFISLMPSLNILLIRRNNPMCHQCKQYPKNSHRILLPTFNTDHNDETVKNHDQCYNPELLSILATTSHLTEYYTDKSFYTNFPYKFLIRYFEYTVDKRNMYCTMCLKECNKSFNSLEIRFTRLKNCKCIHLKGYICSEKCHNKLSDNLLQHYPSAKIITSLESFTFDSFVQNNEIEKRVHKRLRNCFLYMFECFPLHRNHSYTVTAS